MCKCLGIHHSVYYYHCNHQTNSYKIANQKLDVEIKKIYDESNFKYIRFYGAYCNTTKCHKFFLKLCNEKSIEFKKSLNKWRMKIMTNFKVDPLSCPICNTTMLYLKCNYF